MVYYHFEMESPQKLICTAKDCTEERADQSPNATNRHCRKHRNEAQKNYLMGKAEQEEARAFHKGVEAMREFIASGFDKYGPNQKWTGPQFAHIIRNLKAPVLREVSLPSPVAS